MLFGFLGNFRSFKQKVLHLFFGWSRQSHSVFLLKQCYRLLTYSRQINHRDDSVSGEKPSHQAADCVKANQAALGLKVLKGSCYVV